MGLNIESLPDPFFSCPPFIQGNAGDMVVSDYGDAWIEDAYREIKKIPRYSLDR